MLRLKSLRYAKPESFNAMLTEKPLLNLADTYSPVKHRYEQYLSFVKNKYI
jgi:hypothetical protein